MLDQNGSLDLLEHLLYGKLSSNTKSFLSHSISKERTKVRRSLTAKNYLQWDHWLSIKPKLQKFFQMDFLPCRNKHRYLLFNACHGTVYSWDDPGGLGSSALLSEHGS
jgi:hypothetical protein